ncbi:winged helix-turn-helix domain-containing protein [Aquimarina sp. 433]
MKKKVKVVAILIVVLIGYISIYSFSAKPISFYPEKVKVALRSVGNQLLLKNNDTTSLVLPIKRISDKTYEISFQKEIAINPEELVEIIDVELKKTKLPQNYITELIDCTTKEVSYSYEVLGPIEENSISCIGRNLPESCYTIKVMMLDDTDHSLYGSVGNVYTFSLLVLLLIAMSSLTFFKRKEQNNTTEVNSNHRIIGEFLFFPDQQKLVKDETEISLTTKESEILNLLARQPNQIIKREQLIKEVWEDNGVIVGRSLDMFISKLRKKLTNNAEVKIVNIHGVGYKLEVTTKN